MARATSRRWAVFWAVFILAFAAVFAVHAAQILLIAKVTYALVESDGTTPLADGSIVYIIGSKDNVNDGMYVYGDALIADSVQGDDVFIGEVRIDSTGTGSNGTFQTADYYFEDDDVDYLYIRFFDTTAGWVEGLVTWGQSPLFPDTNHPYGVEWLDFIGGYAAINTNTFVVIPEPGTGSLVLLLAGLVWGMRVCMKGGQGKRGQRMTME